LSILGGVVWIVGLADGLFGSANLWVYLSGELLFIPVAAFTLRTYRTIKRETDVEIRARGVVALISIPFAGSGGALLAFVVLIGASPDRIIDAARSVLEFDAFLTIGWTIGFGILDRWLKEFRETRRQLVLWKRKGMKEAGEAVDIMQGKPAEVFGGLVTSIGLFIFSGVLAVLTVLTGNGLLLGCSTTLLLVGVALMLVSWYGIYQSANFLQTTRDVLSDLSQAETTEARGE